mgnify:CR=1 FL=1
MVRILLVLLTLVLALGRVQAGELGVIRHDALPPEAKQTLKLVERGGPFPYRRDGVVFQNREGRLPGKPRGYYREFTVPTPGIATRGARRIIVGRNAPGNLGRGETYYTEDHYRTFMRIEP